MTFLNHSERDTQRFFDVCMLDSFISNRGKGLCQLICLATVAALIGSYSVARAETWRGLTVAPESRCSPYNSNDYRYSSSVEGHTIANMNGKIYSPYTGRCFSSASETDIEHIIARSEAHDSGLCAADNSVRHRFSNDLLNITLASPQLNRGSKSDKDASQWMPMMNRCWFANQVVRVRRKYNLTIDRLEAVALERILSQCSSTVMVDQACSSSTTSSPIQPSSAGNATPLELWDDNKNGRITCSEARAHGITPVQRGHPAYQYMRDGDGDGVVCE